jgi:hypothetical protein
MMIIVLERDFLRPRKTYIFYLGFLGFNNGMEFMFSIFWKNFGMHF